MSRSIILLIRSFEAPPLQVVLELSKSMDQETPLFEVRRTYPESNVK